MIYSKPSRSHDIQWLKEELAEKQKMLGSLEQEWQSAKQASVDSRSVRRKPASIIKK
jgi:hypothetical protein